jgi:hypothetical protein
VYNVTDWARDLAEKKKKELDLKRAQEAKDLSDRQMLNGVIDQMWVDVREQTKKAVKEFNEAMESEYVIFRGASDHNSFTLETKGGVKHSVFLSRANWQITSGAGGDQRYALTIIAGNGVIWMDQSRSAFSAEEIAHAEVGTAVKPQGY